MLPWARAKAPEQKSPAPDVAQVPEQVQAPGQAQGVQAHTGLVKYETVIPMPHVLIPAWMADAYLRVSTVYKKARRLWLPVATLETKLPYHACAPING